MIKLFFINKIQAFFLLLPLHLFAVSWQQIHIKILKLIRGRNYLNLNVASLIPGTCIEVIKSGVKVEAIKFVN
ncbi:MAG: hypothetical protein ABI237_05575 [Ginsengibacter sp.]